MASQQHKFLNFFILSLLLPCLSCEAFQLALLSQIQVIFTCSVSLQATGLGVYQRPPHTCGLSQGLLSLHHYPTPYSLLRTDLAKLLGYTFHQLELQMCITMLLSTKLYHSLNLTPVFLRYSILKNSWTGPSLFHFTA